MNASIKKVATTAKSTVIKVAQVPQHIGRTILSVPSKIADKRNGKNVTESKQQYADKVEFICKDILEDQESKQLVRESQSSCMKEVVRHLNTFLGEHIDATYEQWIAALHPDNAEYMDGRIDHRFYVVDSDHRIYWNKVMTELGFLTRVIETKSILPSYNRTI
jgi:hypothetical protein